MRMLSVDEQIRIISKGVKTIVGMEELREKLDRSIQSEEPLIVKLGLDPSAPDIHLGHSVVLRKIKQLQDLGHEAVIVIGDFTGKIGDPTGKSRGRQALTKEEVLCNAKTYEEQIFKILNREKTKVCFNSEWLSKLKFEDTLALASTTTVARMLERDDFNNRYKNNIPIGIHEFFYPLMQAYDSIHLKADIEIGGTDQTFNILMGRNLQKSMGMEQQVALFMPILEGLDGLEKMSKSLGNYIGIHEAAQVIFKKVMEIPDQLIIKYYELVTDIHPDEIDKIKDEIAHGRNPRDIKFELATIITGLYHNVEDTKQAMDYFEIAFTKKEIPENIPELIIELDKDKVIDLIQQLLKEGYITSGSEFRRLVMQGGVKINNETIWTEDFDRVLYCNDVVKIGKKKFIRIIK